MDRQVTPPKRVTSPTWGPSPPCKQALKKRKKNSSKCVHVLRIIHKTSRGGMSRCTRAVASKKCTKKVRCTCRVVFSGPLCFCFFFANQGFVVAAPDEFFTGWKIRPATSLTRNRSIFCESVYTNLEKLRVHNFRTVKVVPCERNTLTHKFSAGREFAQCRVNAA